MRRVLGVVLGALALAGCAGFPSGNWLSGFSFGGKPQETTVELRMESQPPGADARTSLGQQCRTPCVLQVSAASDFSVSFTLDGHLPQTVAVRVKPPGNPQIDPAASETAQFDPNPVFAELHPEPRRGRRGPR